MFGQFQGLTQGVWVAGAAEQDFCRPRRALGAGPRDSPQESWVTDEQEDTTRGLLSASEAPSLSPQLLKVDNTLGQSHQEGWGKCKTLTSPGDSEC